VKHGLDQYLRHYSSYFTFHGPKLDKANADLFESILCAIYLEDDCSLDRCIEFVDRFLLKDSSMEIYCGELGPNPKGLYQHLVQRELKGMPEYKVIHSLHCLFNILSYSNIGHFHNQHIIWNYIRDCSVCERKFCCKVNFELLI
jgi:hypothetical protein